MKKLIFLSLLLLILVSIGITYVFVSKNAAKQDKTDFNYIRSKILEMEQKEKLAHEKMRKVKEEQEQQVQLFIQGMA